MLHGIIHKLQILVGFPLKTSKKHMAEIQQNLERQSFQPFSQHGVLLAVEPVDDHLVLFLACGFASADEYLYPVFFCSRAVRSI